MTKGKDILRNMLESDRPKSDPGTPGLQPAPHRSPGAIRAMNLSLGKLNEEAAAAKSLREAIASGDTVIELDVGLIDDSFARDRFVVNQGASFDELKNSIEEHGQQVPILVRPHPDVEGRYQIAYGHRRHRAAQDLKRPVRAMVRPLTDRELLLAQGQENGLRADLSFIERAMFAHTMEKRGYDREVISSALAVDKPEASRLLQVANNIPSELVSAIGPAPKIGRPRWLALADKLQSKSTKKLALAAAADSDFGLHDSNRRFERVWKAISAKSGIQDPETIKSRAGKPLASLIRSKTGAKITLHDQRFADFVLKRVKELVREFEINNGGKSDG